MRAKRRMTAAEFKAVRPFLKISDDRIKAARAALVEGQTFQAIGDRFGWSRQAVDQAVSKGRLAHLGKIPPIAARSGQYWCVIVASGPHQRALTLEASDTASE
ncbi:hypothetical protein XFHB_14075 (plasmid) [Xylella fastidiosa]|uniref:TrfB transcriptional repressor protein domain-containing protein n=1 Tax=Xylella fastidiosa TaxID=2371 RepID=A0ABD7BZ70_XYLFS|nr:TrfB-related DNA-binding protein [Xylella fastidiosa]QPB72726.1 hypothetical protein XFHB_14075 [Xylella fastidiosa]